MFENIHELQETTEIILK